MGRRADEQEDFEPRSYSIRGQGTSLCCAHHHYYKHRNLLVVPIVLDLVLASWGLGKRRIEQKDGESRGTGIGGEGIDLRRANHHDRLNLLDVPVVLVSPVVLTVPLVVSIVIDLLLAAHLGRRADEQEDFEPRGCGIGGRGNDDLSAG